MLLNNNVTFRYGFFCKLYLLFLLASEIISMVAPQRKGILALTQIAGLYLFIPLIPLITLAFRQTLNRDLFYRTLLILCLFAGLLHLPPLTPAVEEQVGQKNIEFKVMQWNVRWTITSEQKNRLRPLLMERPADIIVLEEANWEWLATDHEIKTIYPYQLIRTPQASSGIVILSTLPFLERGVAEVPSGERGWPRLIWVRIDLGQGQSVRVVAIHTPAPHITPLGLDASEREALLPRIREFVDPAIVKGEPVIVVGDLNVTEREPFYADISKNLTDAFKYTNNGNSSTWGVVVAGTLHPLLRIDYIFVNRTIVPLSTVVDCSVINSDHCMLYGWFRVAAK